MINTRRTRRATNRAILAVVATLMLFLAAFIVWELGWAISGIRVFAEDFAREQGDRGKDFGSQVNAIGDGLHWYVTYRLERLALVVPGILVCTSAVLIVLAFRLPPDGA